MRLPPPPTLNPVSPSPPLPPPTYSRSLVKQYATTHSCAQLASINQMKRTRSDERVQKKATCSSAPFFKLPMPTEEGSLSDPVRRQLLHASVCYD